MIYDFSGYVTKNDIRCNDGRIIRQNAFKDMDGKTVPLVYNHGHKSLNDVIGHVLLENRTDGVYGYGTLNKEIDGGKTALSLIKHGDINSLSVYANNLHQRGSDVYHGVIREVSLVLSGANSGAVIDNVMAHGIDSEDEDGERGIQIYAGEENPIIHSDAEEEYEEYLAHAAASNDDPDDDDFDLEGTIATMTEDQKKALKIMAGLVAEQVENEMAKQSNTAQHSSFSLLADAEEFLSHSGDDGTEEQIEGDNYNDDEGSEFNNDDTNDDEQTDSDLEHDGFGEENLESNENYLEHNSEEGENEMRTNLIDGVNTNMNGETMIHSGILCKSIIEDAQKFGTFSESVMAHSGEYGIDNIEMLFPEAKAEDGRPEYIKRRTEWVAAVWDGVRKSPFARVKSIFADITEDDARAKGYIKGNRKTEEVFTLLKRETSPTTVYKKQKIDRDDVADITTFDVLSWIRDEMRIMFDEEVARAILIGDGRPALSQDKIKEDCIRPIWKDDDLFTIKKAIPVSSSTSDQTKAKTLIRTIIKSFKQYKGSGKPTLFISPDLLADMLLIEDKNERVIYDTLDKLKNTLRVADIVEVPIFENVNRLDGSDTKYLAALMVNLNDYRVGQDKNGKLAMFDGFDIDYNQQKYLIEARMSGALTKPYSAVAFEFVYNLTIDVQAEEPTKVILGKFVSELQDDVYVGDNYIQGTLKYVTGYTQFDPDHIEDQSGYYLALKYEASEGAEVFVKTIGGYHDDLGEQKLDDDMNTVFRIKSNREKIVVKVVLNDDQITKTLSCAGLKMVQ